MAIENTAFILGLGILFNYFIVYKRNRFFGNILYILLSMLTFYHGSTLLNADKNIVIAIGIFMFIGSIINMIYDIFYNNKNTKHRKIG